MVDWHGYVLITVTTALTGQQKRNIRDRLLELGRQVGLPHERTQFRARLDGQAIILECTVPTQLDKAMVAAKIAVALGLPEAVVDASSTFQRFAGADWEASRQACAAYLGANGAAWNEENL